MKKLMILIVMVFAAGTFNLAQAQKFGHVNSQELLLAMPETAQMQKALQNKSAEFEGQLKLMYQEYQTKMVELQNGAEQMSEPIREAKIQDLQDLEQRIQGLEQNAQQNLLKLEEELTLPILEKARNAIKDVANEGGYAYVFDLSSGALVHYPEGDDITSKVKSKLGI